MSGSPSAASTSRIAAGPIFDQHRLAPPPTVGRLITATLVDEFRKRFPKATLGIVEGLSVNVTEWLVSGRIDVGLVAMLRDVVPREPADAGA